MAIKLNGSTSGSVALDAPADTSPSGTDVTLTLPTSAGSSGQYLQTNGSGTLSWQTVTSTEYQGPAFQAVLSSNQNISSSTWTKVQLTNETFDTDNCYDNSTNYRFTPTKAGYYQVNGSIYLDYSGTASTSTSSRIYKNGSLYVGVNTTTSNTNYGSSPLSTIVYLNGSTDYIELFGWSNGTSAYFQSASNMTYFSAVWVHD